YSTSKPRRFMSSPRKCAHASYRSPGGFTVGIRTRSAVSCTISSRARSTSALTRSTRAASTMQYCSAMKRIALALACIAAAATGTVRWLEEHNIGWPAGSSRVPIVPAAILFDLGVGGNPKIRPTADCGYKAADAATTGVVQEGTVGAGAGATVGKFGGAGRSTKSGIGTASIALPSGLVVGAIVAVNAVGDVIDPATGKV